MATELKAPTGKTRVVGIDLFDHTDYLFGDFESQDEAFRVADEKNTEREGSMDDVYYVYNDEGELIRDNTAVVGPGICP